MSDDESDLGWWAICGAELLAALRRVERGEKADLVYAEMWANCEHESVDDDEEEA